MGALVAVARLLHLVYIGRTGTRIRATHSLSTVCSIKAAIQYCKSGFDFGFSLLVPIEDAGETEVERLVFIFLVELEGQKWEWKEQALEEMGVVHL